MTVRWTNTYWRRLWQRLIRCSRMSSTRANRLIERRQRRRLVSRVVQPSRQRIVEHGRRLDCDCDWACDWDWACDTD